MQVGFDLDFADPRTGIAVPWAEPTSDLLAAIKAAKWKIVDGETTELNPASKPLAFSGRDLQRGVDPTPRLRVVSVLFPTETGIHVKAFDLDKWSVAERKAICDAALTGVFFGHNAGFDVYWARTKIKTLPRKVLDSMLIARILVPEQPLLMAKMLNDENEQFDLKESAQKAFEQRRGGWALEHLVLTHLRKIMSKDSQGPKNWTEPFLTQEKYDYATGDVVDLHKLLCLWFKCSEKDDLLAAYEAIADRTPTLRLVEPQVLDVVLMREHGMPWNVQEAVRYCAGQAKKVAEFAHQMIELEPELERFRSALGDANAGVTDDLKEAIGECFRRRGLVLETTEKTASPKIGEKDLRKAGGAINADVKPLFDVWTSLNRAKKAGNMAMDFSAYAQRSGDGLIHSNLGHGPATGRLAASEPNVQQAPRDQGFRNAVEARPGYKMVASDYSALDMRVAAALAIRAQQQIAAAYRGEVKVPDEVYRAIRRAYNPEMSLERLAQMEESARQQYADHHARIDEMAKSDDSGVRKDFWERWRQLKHELLLARFARCLKYVRDRADKAGTPEWGSLRDAFSIPGMDIHTWTALSMNGEDPVALFSGLSDEAVADELKVQKKKLGSKRTSGKVSNLSLTYAMEVLGFQTSASSIHNIHWTFEEAAQIRTSWLATYVEVALWHCWTALNPKDTVYVPDPDKGMRFVKKVVYGSVTLGNRLIYAMGLNAALAYEDQSTGADILGTAMDVFHREYPDVFKMIRNQIHDECVFEVPVDGLDDYVRIITTVMVEAAEKFTMPYGVRVEVSPAIGDVWLKD